MNPLMRTNNNLPSLIENFFGRDMNDFFNTNAPAMHNLPAVNVVEHQDGFRIEVAAPGLKKEDFKLNLNHNNLTISAYQESQKEDREQNGESGRRPREVYASGVQLLVLSADVYVANFGRCR